MDVLMYVCVVVWKCGGVDVWMCGGVMCGCVEV